MKRDMDLVRQILLAIEADGWKPGDRPDVPGHSDEAIDYHVWLAIGSSSACPAHELCIRPQHWSNVGGRTVKPVRPSSFTGSLLMADLNDAIEGSAKKPRKAEIDGKSAEAHSLPDQIAADKYLKGQAALAGGRSGWGATRPARLVPPGTVGPGANSE